MAVELDKYRGREQTYIKHSFLTQYLQEAGYKILQGRSRTFNFVDAFAGPWHVSDDINYSDASFDQALQTLHVVRDTLGSHGVTDLKIRACFCEKRAQSVEKLRRYAKQKTNFEPHVFHGAFEDHLENIASVCQDGFTFTFIDPTGWNIRSKPVFEFLRDRRGEFLMNFMAEHVNRHAGYSGVSDSFGRFLAAPNWETDYNALPSIWSNEERVLYILKSKIKEMRAATYLPDLAIQKPRINRVKMRLILGTRSTMGLKVFRDVQEKVERTEIEMRNQQHDSGDHQIKLFPEEYIAAVEQKAAGVGCPKFQKEAEKQILNFLSDQQTALFSDISADVLENIPMRLTQTRTLVNKMKEQGILEFNLPSGRRVPQPGTRISLANQKL